MLDFRDNHWYEAKVIKTRPPDPAKYPTGRIRIHFKGWTKAQDEWIDLSSKRLKRLPAKYRPRPLKPAGGGGGAAGAAGAAAAAGGSGGGGAGGVGGGGATGAAASGAGGVGGGGGSSSSASSSSVGAGGVAAAAGRQAAPAMAAEGDEASSDGPLLDVAVGQQVTVSHMGMRYNADVRQVTDSSRGRRALVHYRRNGDAPVTEWVALTRLSPAGRVRTSPRNNPSTASRLAAVNNAGGGGGGAAGSAGGGGGSSSSAAAGGGAAGGPSFATAESMALVVHDEDDWAGAVRVPARAGRARGSSSSAAAASSSSYAAAAAASSSSSTSASASAQGAAALPEGWATAAAAETLREFGERKFYAADWFTAFSAHAITKRSGELPGRLLARFVIAVNDLQMLGLCHASKRPRGTIEKRVFG